MLFTGSIRENIERGKPGASMAEIESAAKKAFAHDFITSFTVSVSVGLPSLSTGSREFVWFCGDEKRGRGDEKRGCGDEKRGVSEYMKRSDESVASNPRCSSTHVMLHSRSMQTNLPPK